VSPIVWRRPCRVLSVVRVVDEVLKAQETTRDAAIAAVPFQDIN
jgi:hypothetical protein